MISSVWWSFVVVAVLTAGKAMAQIETLSSGNFVQDTACASTKTCFSDCAAGTGCTYEAACSADGSTATCTITLKSSVTGDAYIALGFSSDQSMGGDSVTGCKRRGNQFSIFNAQNNGRVPGPEEFSDDGVTLTGSESRDSVIRCTFTRTMAAGVNGDRFDLNQAWYWLLATGSLTADGALTRHSRQERFFSADLYDLSPSGSGQPPATQPPPPETTTPSLTGSLAKDSRCGTTRGCFSKCDSASSCTFTVAWSLDADPQTATYTLRSDVGSSGSYVALGFSDDGNMGDDDVIGCLGVSDGTARLFSAENEGKSPQLYTDNRVTLVSGDMTDGVLTCVISRPVESYDVAGRVRKDIDQPKTLLFARASGSLQNGVVSISYHTANGRFVSTRPLAASQTEDDSAEDEDYPLIKAHGALMIGAWVFLASIGIVAARYYKPVWENDLCSQKVWFQIHRTCMVLAFCSCVAGFVVIFVETEEWIEIVQKPSYLEGHPIMGVIVTGLCVLNPLMALIRPHPGTQYRPIFNWAHWFVGTAAHVLGVVTIFFGFELDKADAPDYLKYILAGYVGWQALVELTLELMACCCSRKERQDAYEMSDLNGQPKQGGSSGSDGLHSVRKGIFVLHMLVVTAISAVLIGLLVVGKKELDS